MAAVRSSGTLTPKGRRRAVEIVDAALRCLARDGYAATSLQRVADEAAVSKRVVIYYYGSREGLFGALMHEIGDQLISRLEAVTTGLEEPADIVERGYSLLWEAIINDRALLVAWFGLRAEAVTNPALRDPANYITSRFRGLVAQLIDDQLARGRRLQMERGALEVLVVAGVQGLILEFLERGDTPELGRASDTFRDYVTDAVVEV
ncbi:MAG: hypothetical protein QOG62_2312 [Thermoleophilaceae bacterium]|jgi:AcrR family transcriptional regulator|nr:hypothetical protein [Thermoleophilaceae bacterium]